MTIALHAHELTKRYHKQPALNAISADFQTGHVTGLIGPNGAGKTTLLKLAVGLIEPDAGVLEVFGWSPCEQPGLVLPRVGYVAQDRPMYGRFTVLETLRIGRELNPRWDDHAVTGRLVKHGIDLNQQIRRLSGGQQAQVSLALAIGKRPELLLLDEPAANLDPLARREFLTELLTAASVHGITIVLSSHIVADVERICDHLVILSHGRVQVTGPIRAFLDSHRVLTGPRIDPDLAAQDPTVVRAEHSERESTLLVRLDDAIPPPSWRVEEPALEDLILAYMERPGPNRGAKSSNS
jgi:ABC-2 type transport system ATP-binding protein